MHTDAETLAWYAKLKQYDARQISAKEIGLPESQWFTFETDADAGLDKRGRPIRRKIERYLPTREGKRS